MQTVLKCYRVPNLPFFYLVFRAWSHWRGEHLRRIERQIYEHSRLTFSTALRGSQHLEFLVQHNLVDPEPSSTLDAMYAMKRASIGSPSPESLTDSEPNSSLESPGAEEAILLDETDGKAVAEAIQQPEVAVEVERAIRQIKQARIAKKKAEEEQKMRHDQQQQQQPTDVTTEDTKDKSPKK